MCKSLDSPRSGFMRNSMLRFARIAIVLFSSSATLLAGRAAADTFTAANGLTANSGGPYTITLGDILVLNGSAFETDPRIAIVTYRWDINLDGTYDFTGASGATSFTSATYEALGLNAGGDYTLRFQVFDQQGSVATTTGTLHIDAPVNSQVPEPSSLLLLGSGVV